MSLCWFCKQNVQVSFDVKVSCKYFLFFVILTELLTMILTLTLILTELLTMILTLIRL